MTITTENVLVGIATLWYAPVDPITGPEPMPADTIGEGVDWAGNWIAPGATDQGVKITKAPKTQDITIEEQGTPALVTIDSTDVSIDTSLAEDTLANMALAYGGGTITTVAAGASQVGKSTLTLADNLALLSVGFEGINVDGFWRRVYIPKVLSVASVDTTYRRAAAARLYPVTLRAICAPSDIVVVEKTAEATGS